MLTTLQISHRLTFLLRTRPTSRPNHCLVVGVKARQNDPGSLGKSHSYHSPLEMPPSAGPFFEACYDSGRRHTDYLLSDASSYGNSYQSGGNISDPTSVPQAYTNDPEAAAFASGSYSNGGSGGESDRANAWESRFGWRVDAMAAASYLGGPVTGQSFV